MNFTATSLWTLSVFVQKDHIYNHLDLKKLSI